MTATEPTTATTGVPFVLNGKAVEAEHGELLIEACERNGVHIPRFCYHPRMKPVGMCRMCLVEVDGGRGPGLQPSCMVPVTPDMKVETESQPTKQAQDGILELTLINHPLDCPVCDKGGECPLQDNAYAYGPGESRFVEEKRHYEKPIAISDLVYLDRERCILCDRCTRFADEVAGDPLIHFIDRGSQTQVNTFPDEPFSSYFSGNTVQICPVGALTAEPYRFKARPWDLAEVESTATVDSFGSRIALQSSRDELVRILGVDSDAVNWSWLHDKERFSYEAANSEHRLDEPLVRSEAGEFAPARWADAVAFAAEALSVEPGEVGVIGGARLSVESQYAWTKLVKGVIGTDNVDAQLADGLDPDVVFGLPRATVAEAAEPGGVIVLLSVDPKEELPTLSIRLRHAVVEDGATLIEITPRATGLTAHASARLHPLPGTIGEVVTAIADRSVVAAVGGVGPEQLRLAADLLTADRPVTVVVGRGNLAESPAFVTTAATALQRLVPSARFLPALRRGNVIGALEMGLAPGRTFAGGVTGKDGLGTVGMLQAAAAGDLSTLVLLGSDPLADVPDRGLVSRAFDNVETIVAVDTFLTDSSRRADVVLPAAGFGEVDGSFLNAEHRLSPLRAKVTPPGQARPDWMIAAEIAAALDSDLGFATLDELRTDLASTVDSFADIDWHGMGDAPDGPIVAPGRQLSTASAQTVTAPAVDGYGLRLVVDRKLWDLGTMVQQSESLASLAVDATVTLAPYDFERLGLAEGGRVDIEANGVSVRLPAVAEPGIPRGAARVPFRAGGVDIGRLLSAERPVVDVRVTAI